MAHRHLLLAACLALVGCECQQSRGGGLRSSKGELGIEWHDSSANRFVSRDARYDFGRALIGQSVPLTLEVKNLGGGPMPVVSLAMESGDLAEVSHFPRPGTPFTVDFSPVYLGAGESKSYPMLFTVQPLKEHFETRLVMTAENVDEPTATIVLVGTGEKGACDLPTELDFGRVPVGETFELGIPVRNPSSIDGSASAGDVFGQDAAAFGLAASSPRGQFAVTAGGQATVTFTFAPTELRAYEAHVQLTGVGTCDPVDVTLKGLGSDDVLTWSPSELSFGYVNPGVKAIQELVFVNPSNAPIRLTDLQTSNPDFTFEGQPTFVVPGGAAPTRFAVGCTPSSLGPRQGTLTFKTGLTRIPQGTVALRCTGGGPKIAVTPQPTLAFGRVGLFVGNPTPVVRRVTVQNVGSRPPSPEVAANLHLGHVTPAGYGQPPYFDLTLGAGTSPQELTVSLGSYDNVTGLEATASRNSVELTVTLTPSTLGTKSADLVIHSNDPATPSVTVAITADVQPVAPCNLQITPAVADFGIVNPPNSKDLPIVITNRGVAPGDICYLTNIALAPSSNPFFSIVGGPVVEKELQPQEAWQVVVRVAPTGPAPTVLQPVAGILTFSVSSPTQPQASVPLLATMGPTCLVVTPDPLDFGTIRQGCNSAPRTFNVYNSCSTPITLQSFAVQAAGGQPAGGPQCPGTAPCPEFLLVSSPAIPSTGLTMTPGGAPVTFQMRYHPIDVGADQGAVVINAVQGGGNVTHIVNLQGTGDPLGQQTDTFLQSSQPKADILLVIDDSCSMSDKQASLASNFASFINYATSANVDWQMGVITTSNQPNYSGSVTSGGVLFRNAGSGIPPVLTRTTPLVAQKFGTAVNVGVYGDATECGLEPAVKALTPPIVSNQNAGFLRPDAKLAVVVVSDAADQSPQTVSYYQNRLMNVKGFSQLSMFTFNTIGPLSPYEPTGCTYDYTHDPSRYQTVVGATGGFLGEICTPNWATTLQALGATAFGYRTQFFLNNVPDTSGGRAIAVAINGNPVPPSSGTWSYDVASNSIRFTPASTPTAGQTLTVTYYTACL